VTQTSTGFELRAARPDEMDALFAAIERAFGADPNQEDARYEIPALHPERTLAAYDGDAMVATGGIFTFDMTVPGGPRPVAGVTWIGVLPTHRRRGLLTALMQHQLTELHETGAEPVAALWASEPGIYRRFGYGLASTRLAMRIESRTPFVPGVPTTGRLRLVDAKESRTVAEQLYDQERLRRPGMLSRDQARWDIMFADPEHRREGASSLQCVVLDGTSGPLGYLTYRTKQDWQRGVPKGTVNVRELIATTPFAYAALWRYAIDMDLMSTVDVSSRPVDDPLLYLLTDVRRAQISLGDQLWVRVVDVERALSSRSYSVRDSVVIELTDVGCPWNTGRFRLDGGPEGATCERTDAAADLTLSAVELGAAYLGGTRLRALAAAGFVDEHTAGALARADLMFASAVAPWCGELF
jgi:predicted acetyltransferase